MSGLRARTTSDEFGFFQIMATTPKGIKVNITEFRGVPVQISELVTRDPFGDATCSINIPNVTIFDRPEQGDLRWLQPYTNIDIRWVPPESYHSEKADDDKTPIDRIIEYIEGDEDNPIPGLDDQPVFGYISASQINEYEREDIYRYPLKRWKWEGFIANYDVSTENGLTIQCKGALYQLDNYLSKPEFPRRPIPYETLLTRAFKPETHPGLFTNSLLVAFPDKWNVQVKKKDTEKGNNPGYQQPVGVHVGDDWTGLTSRSTGSWDNTLTGFVQGLLSVMFTKSGNQWTIYKLPGRKPMLKVRKEPSSESTATLVINAENPGVDLSISRDYTQSVNLIYGSGQDLAGVSFSGQQITPDGRNTYYTPFAYAPQVFPPERQNSAYDPKVVVPKEGVLQFPQGLNEIEAKVVANQQYRRFADPGFTGSITLRTDPKFRGEIYPRYLISAGQSIAVRNLMGRDKIVLHIVECSINLVDGSVSLSVDSKFRDFLTWQEVRARTRDALIPLRSLQVGNYSNTIQDLMKPWSNRDGSGVLPSGKDWNATEFFNDLLPSDAQFPYEKWTKKYPPSKADSRKFYMKVPGRDPQNASNNWGGIDRKQTGTGTVWGFPIKAAQAGTIRLLQLAAYDRQGNVKKAHFHASIYQMWANQKGTPKIPKGVRVPFQYKESQYYPLFKNAWETVDEDGVELAPFFYTGPGQDMVAGWGNFWEPAGYSPGLKSAGGKKTGLLIDESQWTFDTTANKDFNPYDKSDNMKNDDVGNLYLLIYCDEDTDPTYFMGRMYRVEPGTS